MPSRINHVKIVTPQPAHVDAFLREVCDIPEGWPLGEAERLAPGTPLGPGGELTTESMAALVPTGMHGFIAGDPSSRQFQILEGTAAACWAIAISTRHVEEVHERAVARGVPCTPISVLENWSGGARIRYFFCQVSGLTFELLRVEPQTR